MAAKGKRPFVQVNTGNRELTDIQRNVKDVLDQLEELRRGLIAFSPVVVAGDYTIGEERYVVYKGTGNHTITLPKANALTGKSRDVMIVNIGDGSTGGLNIKPSGADTLNGGVLCLVESGGTFYGVSDGAALWQGLAGSVGALEIRTPSTTVDRDIFQVMLGGSRLLDVATRNAAIGNRAKFEVRCEIFARGDGINASALHVVDNTYMIIGDGAGVIVGDFGKGGLSIGSAQTDKMALYGVTCVSQDVLPTGAGKTVDDVITHLQRLGSCRQV